FAFLLALELLTPTMRATLLLRDVFDYSVRETAEALGMSEANVKTTLLRARSRMTAYDAERQPTTHAHEERTQVALAQFLTSLRDQDRQALLGLLRADAVALSDGAGEFTAARVPVRGSAKIATFFLKVSRHAAVRYDVRTVNGLPAVVLELLSPPPGV